MSLAFSAPAPARALQRPVPNPILPGFTPDPSIVRVGLDYYLITSTFQYFPAIAIHHSRDLRTWTRIGHVFTDPAQLDLTHFNDGCGIWAPDISHHDGEFHILFCLVQLTKDRSVNVRGNYVVKARNVLGPYSKPVQLTSEGNDPSLFIDDDGSRHMVYAAGIPRGRGVKIVRLSEDGLCTVEAPRWLEFGIEKRAPEGPHLLRRDGYYYLTLAAGGGAYDGHHQLIARSRHLHGPYEESPHGTFIVERSPTAAYYHHGHAKLVRTQDDTWKAVYLLRRRIGGYSPLGRETAIDTIEWQQDGWPILNQGAGPSDHAPSPGPALRDDFDAPQLSPEWMFIRSPLPGCHDLTSRAGHLRLTGGLASPAAPVGVNAVLRRETSHRYTATCLLEFAPRPGEEAGLLAYYDTTSHIAFTLFGTPEPTLRLTVCEAGTVRCVSETPYPHHAPLHLRMRVDGLRRHFEFSPDATTWTEIGEVDRCTFLSDEGTANWGFTGTLVGLYARRADINRALEADFDWLALEPA